MLAPGLPRPSDEEARRKSGRTGNTEHRYGGVRYAAKSWSKKSASSSKRQRWSDRQTRARATNARFVIHKSPDGPRAV